MLRKIYNSLSQSVSFQAIIKEDVKQCSRKKEIYRIWQGENLLPMLEKLQKRIPTKNMNVLPSIKNKQLAYRYRKTFLIHVMEVQMAH